jgi:hypothetical protein
MGIPETSEGAAEHHEGDGGLPHPEAADRLVTVEVETVEQVRPGPWRVADLKKALKIEPALVLSVLEKSGLKDLKDDAEIEICGGEQFIAHAHSGGSS